MELCSYIIPVKAHFSEKWIKEEEECVQPNYKEAWPLDWAVEWKMTINSFFWWFLFELFFGKTTCGVYVVDFNGQLMEFPCSCFKSNTQHPSSGLSDPSVQNRSTCLLKEIWKDSHTRSGFWARACWLTYYSLEQYHETCINVNSLCLHSAGKLFYSNLTKHKVAEICSKIASLLCFSNIEDLYQCSLNKVQMINKPASASPLGLCRILMMLF